MPGARTSCGTAPSDPSHARSAWDDEVQPDGSIDDARRVAYLADHLEAAVRAIDAGAPLKGYFAWSLLDNFEWAEGYAKRFGLVRVDYDTQKRTVKRSGAFYRGVVTSARTRSTESGDTTPTP